jgi:hypothetical protein
MHVQVDSRSQFDQWQGLQPHTVAPDNGDFSELAKQLEALKNKADLLHESQRTIELRMTDSPWRFSSPMHSNVDEHFGLGKAEGYPLRVDPHRDGHLLAGQHGFGSLSSGAMNFEQAMAQVPTTVRPKVQPKVQPLEQTLDGVSIETLTAQIKALSFKVRLLSDQVLPTPKSERSVNGSQVPSQLNL